MRTRKATSSVRSSVVEFESVAVLDWAAIVWSNVIVYYVMVRLEGVIYHEPMAFPLDVIERDYAPFSVRDEMGNVVIWKYVRTKKASG